MACPLSLLPCGFTCPWLSGRPHQPDQPGQCGRWRSDWPGHPDRMGRPATLDAFVCEAYLPYIRLRKRSWRVDERIARQHLSPTFGTRELADIDRREVADWFHSLRAASLAPATCNRILAVFKTICAMAELSGCLAQGQSPCAGLAPFRVHARRERYLSRGEARRLMRALEHCARPEAFALRLLLLTGARKSEILRARWEHVSLEQRLLHVPLAKSGKPHRIPLSGAALQVLRTMPRTEASPWLFPGHAPGKPLSDLYLFWNRIRRELGIADVRIHDLRHTFASFLVNAGHSLYEVQTVLGHGDPRTTMRYAHLGRARLLEAAETVSGCCMEAETARTRRPGADWQPGGAEVAEARKHKSLLSRQDATTRNTPKSGRSESVH